MSVAVVISLAVLVYCGFYYLSYSMDKKDWNGGCCKRCLTPWESFDMDSTGAVGHTCNCGRAIWIGHKKLLRRQI